jgi:hypothetical protein
MKKSFIKLIISTLFVWITMISCNNNSTPKNSSEVEDEKRYLKVVEEKRYSDIDLFTFQPIENEKQDPNFYVTIEESENGKEITVVNGKNKNTRVYKKNLKGYYTDVVLTNSEENNPGYKLFNYIVYSEDRIIHYLIETGVNRPMFLSGYFVLLPIDKEHMQRKLRYNIKERKINSFEEIDYQSDLERPITNDFVSEMIYEFDFEKKIVHEYSMHGGIKRLYFTYDIKNSRSLATPLRNYWRTANN